MATQGLLINVKLLSEQQLVDLYMRAYDKWLEITSIMQFSGQGSEFTSKELVSLETTLSECNYALKQKNPGKYAYITTAIKPYFV